MNDALRAALDPVVLSLLEQKPDHGYSLMVRIKDATGQDLSDGSLYPALYRLEAANKIEGEWTVAENGRKRKVFRITERGQQTLRKARLDWRPFASRLTAILDGA